jgi:hemerythrin superfamily protein
MRRLDRSESEMPAAHIPTHAKTTSKRSGGQAKSNASAHARDAVSLLEADHREVETLFGQFERARDEDQRLQLAQQICLELRIHMEIEEEIFYPTSRDFLSHDEIVNEAIVEHQAAKDLMDAIEGVDPADMMFDARMLVLKEQIERHVEEEEKALFPQVQKSDMDLDAVGAKLAARKRALMIDLCVAFPSTH